MLIPPMCFFCERYECYEDLNKQLHWASQKNTDWHIKINRNNKCKAFITLVTSTQSWQPYINTYPYVYSNLYLLQTVHLSSIINDEVS